MTLTLDGLLVWTQGDKLFYATTVLAVEPLGQEITDPDTGLGLGIFEEETSDYTYDMQVVLHCRTDDGEEFTITTPWTPVHFANFDNC